MTIPLVLFTLLTCVTAVVMPWLGVVVYYVLAVGQFVGFYPHHFGEFRSSLYITLATIVGLGIATAAQQVDWRRLVQLPNLLMMLLVVMVNVSYNNSFYAEFVDIKLGALTPEEMISTFNKVLLFYFIAVLLIDTRLKLVFLIAVMMGVLTYYIVWANHAYLTEQFWRYGDNGRLNGPKGQYQDENYLAMMFLICTPIFYYMAIGTKNWFLRVGLWLAIPFSWHALFLTGSRGALASLAVVCLYIFLRSYSKKASVVLMLVFVVALIDQGGPLIERLTNTVTAEEKQREAMIGWSTEDSEKEFDKNYGKSTIDPRIISWQVGLHMMKDNPVFGVGLGSFMRAFPEYDKSEPHVAHNTFIQFGATSGVVASLIYLYFLYLRLKNAGYHMFSRSRPEKTYPLGLCRDYLDDLINGLFISFYCVALFLDLMLLEITYFIFLIGYCKYSLDRPVKVMNFSLIDSIYRRRDLPEKEIESGELEQPANAVAMDDDSIVVDEPEPVRNQYANQHYAN